MRGTCISKK